MWILANSLAIIALSTLSLACKATPALIVPAPALAAPDTSQASLQGGLAPACRQRVKVYRPLMARGPSGSISKIQAQVKGVICDHVGNDTMKCGGAIGLFHRQVDLQEYIYILIFL